jgi:hypothetical protein
MVNYQNTKIYKIESHLGDKIYIGSTTKEYLSQRMDKHRSGYKRWKDGKYGSHVRSYDLFDEYGIENCKIMLIELYPCNISDERSAREGYYIRTMECVNKQIVGRNKKETIRAYYEMHQDKIKEFQKKYKIDNMDTLKQNKHDYYKVNKNLINDKQNQQFNCECGGHYSRSNKSKHFISKKHLNYLESKK